MMKKNLLTLLKKKEKSKNIIILMIEYRIEEKDSEG